MSRSRFQVLAFAAGLLGLTSAASANLAGTVYVAVGSGRNPVPGATVTGPFFGGQNPYEAGEGGEFTIFAKLTGQSNYYIPAGYDSQAVLDITTPGSAASHNEPFGVGPLGTGFESFCAEDDVGFQVGATYNWRLGLGLFGEPNAKDANGNKITSLTVGAAYLYQLFATGQLTGYYSNDIQTRIDNAGFLQSALWALEGEIPANGTGGNLTDPLFQGGSDNPYLDLAEKEFNNSLLDAQAAVTVSNEKMWDVQLMELTDSSGHLGQAQFVYLKNVSVPDTAATFTLLSFAFAGMVSLRRRFAPAR